jgi:hypothetical protein
MPLDYQLGQGLSASVELVTFVVSTRFCGALVIVTGLTFYDQHSYYPFIFNIL